MKLFIFLVLLATSFISYAAAQSSADNSCPSGQMFDNVTAACVSISGNAGLSTTTGNLSRELNSPAVGTTGTGLNAGTGLGTTANTHNLSSSVQADAGTSGSATRVPASRSTSSVSGITGLPGTTGATGATGLSTGATPGMTGGTTFGGTTDSFGNSGAPTVTGGGTLNASSSAGGSSGSH
ncbi:MAG TPA: hypothetical protein VL688_01070 [Verrucomicrobiae bacterium]|jgi:hypothetical protein|nr:hypothetical protein [Verrucomicrobiae bacterium]